MLKSTKAGALDGRVQFKAAGFELVRGQISGHVRIAHPAYDDAREWLGDEKAIPGIDDPGALGLQMERPDRNARDLRELDGSHLGVVDGAARAVGGEDGRDAALKHALEAEHAFAAGAGTGAADGVESKKPQCAGNELAIKAAADQNDGVRMAKV